ncbi:MAG: tRNA (adenosine(37)-N6)-threonylcarbamoyltransferase complex transferase subunit TsaD [Clostridiales bacterium]|nr:tRNA (adenosine(37)-N6)-threonylcarbamoyltransferase complex transferase subunit TsaD [Clostridiales bacterium]
MRILAVESSCDETAMAVVEDGRRVLSQAIASQINIHALYGGVVPEIASREHVLALDPLLDQVLPQGETVDAVAVTFGPGLVGALLTGVSWAKGFAYARGLPLIPVNHIEGHVSANYIAHPSLEPPFVCLVASGGHSHIVRVDDYGSYTLLGQTTDDAAGEAFDKAARVIGIPYPGGPLLDKLAEQGDEHAYHFPKAHVKGKYDYSFSGVKTAVINETHRLKQMGQEIRREDFAASFRRAVVDMLVEKAVAAAVDSGAGKLALSGGVAANQLLRREARERGERAGLAVYMPPVSLCTDNAAMIGSAAYYRYLKGELAPLSLNAQPSLRLIGQE